MRGHGLMQAIARVNRVFRDKPGGLVVDYLGLADELGLSDDELAFYDALETNDRAVAVLGDETLKTIARELPKISSIAKN
jgi:type I site-specific restriction-modification system R (restriction) subunit